MAEVKALVHIIIKGQESPSQHITENGLKEEFKQQRLRTHSNAACERNRGVRIQNYNLNKLLFYL